LTTGPDVCVDFLNPSGGAAAVAAAAAANVESVTPVMDDDEEDAADVFDDISDVEGYLFMAELLGCWIWTW
jgi:hypothetical protein